MRSSYCPGGRSRKRKMPSTEVADGGIFAALLVATTVAPATGTPYWSSTSPWIEAKLTPRSGKRRSGPGSTVTDGTSCAQDSALPNKETAHRQAATQTQLGCRIWRPSKAQSSACKVSRVITGTKLLGNHSAKGPTMRLQILGSSGTGIGTKAPVSQSAKFYHRSIPVQKRAHGRLGEMF